MFGLRTDVYKLQEAMDKLSATVNTHLKAPWSFDDWAARERRHNERMVSFANDKISREIAFQGQWVRDTIEAHVKTEDALRNEITSLLALIDNLTERIERFENAQGS
jgi:hypothetical protein